MDVFFTIVFEDWWDTLDEKVIVLPVTFSWFIKVYKQLYEIKIK